MRNGYTPILRPLLRNPSDWKFWIAASLLLRAAIFIFQLSQDRPNEVPGFIGSTSQDTESYLLPVDNLISDGSYDPDYRMPGYAVLYFPLGTFFSKSTACNIIIFVQLFLGALSVYCLALTAKNCFRSDRIFHITFWLFAVSTYTSIFDVYLLSESLCTSAIILSAWFYSNYLQGKRESSLALSGLFLTWAMFLRPMYAPLFGIFLILLFFHILKLKGKWTSLLRSTFIFLLPLVIIQSAWMLRNYMVHNRVVLLTTSLYAADFERSYVLELMNFVKAWGGDRTWWNEGSEMRWFGVIEHGTPYSATHDARITIPTYIYTSQFNQDSLEMVRAYIAKINDRNTSDLQREEYTGMLNEKLVGYTESIEEEKPFLYYVRGPFRLFKRFFFHSGTYNLFDRSFGKLSVVEKSAKIFYSFLYVTILCVGLVSTVLVMIRSHNDPAAMLITSILLYSVILFPFILRQIEYRYFVPAYPFLVVMSSYGLMEAGRYFGRR